MTDEPTIETVDDVAGVETALGVFRAVWGKGASTDVDTYVAIVRHGGYMSVARAGGLPIGAAFGFVSDGGRGLHSHIAAVVPAHAGRGVGRSIKLHQRAWAAAHGLEHITWTFDPLVRRNAWFNLVRLGAEVIGYHVNYYGMIDDAINGGDETDRLEVRWSVNDACPAGAVGAGQARDHRLVATPADIESLRATDPAEAVAWRLRMRESLGSSMAAGARVVGLTGDGDYVLTAGAPGEAGEAGSRPEGSP
jgi:predicted GNAT superfamily acetyltransferase